jgi:hypothetical protein
MEELEKLYGKGLINQIRKENVPPPPNIPQPNPERSPPLNPNPEETPTSAGSSTENYVCQICKKSFNSKDELELHIETDHKTRKIPAQQ